MYLVVWLGAHCPVANRRELNHLAVMQHKLNRAFELVRARRFVALIHMRPHMPGGWIKLPLDVDMRDVIFWMRRISP